MTRAELKIPNRTSLPALHRRAVYRPSDLSTLSNLESGEVKDSRLPNAFEAGGVSIGQKKPVSWVL